MKLTQCRLCLQKTVRNLIRFVFYPRPPCSELFHAIFDSWPLYQSKNRTNYHKTPFLVTKRSQKSYPNIRHVSLIGDTPIVGGFIAIFDSWPFYQEKNWKAQNTVFGYKTASKILSDMLFWSATPKLRDFICYFRLIIILSS